MVWWMRMVYSAAVVCVKKQSWYLSLEIQKYQKAAMLWLRLRPERPLMDKVGIVLVLRLYCQLRLFAVRDMWQQTSKTVIWEQKLCVW
jgi:hypothetical protein